MQNYIKITEGNQTLFLIPITETEEGMVYLDATKVVKPAINKDRRHEYGSENGPNFGIEISRAMDYAAYLSECTVTSKNYHKFNTRRGYSLFIQTNV